MIDQADDVLAREQPDAVLLYGDTNTGLAVIAAKRRKIPVFHMEAGNRCFDQRVPEELNRKIVDHLSDINLVLTEHARRYLLAEGLRPETIIKTGSHMAEVLSTTGRDRRLRRPRPAWELEPRKYFVVSAHREENVDDPATLAGSARFVAPLADDYDYPVIVSTHPRTRKRLAALDQATDHPLLRFCKPFGFPDYIKLQMTAYCVLSDSGTITEEASLLNLPAVTIRNAHERPEGMDEGTLVMCGLAPDRVLDAVRVVTAQHDPARRTVPVVPDYQPGPVSIQVVRVVLSYIDYVNRIVWHKA